MFIGARTSRLAAVAIMVLISGGARAQFTQGQFTSYNTLTPTQISNIQAGLLSLYSIPVDSLVPTQINVGFAETNAKSNAFNLIPNTTALTADLLGDVEPVVIGPNGMLYQTDGHHTFVALENSVYGASNPNVFVQVIANYSSLTQAQFVSAMAQNTQLYPFANGVQQPVTQVGANLLSPIPASLAGLTNDPYRGLEYSVLKNTGSGGVGHDKTAGYSDFMWGDAYRTAAGTAGGSGLPFLTPANANAAALWSMNGNNVANLPGHAPILVNQMPGYILPTTGSINVTGQITNANLGTGAIDGGNSGSVATPSMQGLNGYTTNGIVVVPQVSGLLMQLGADNGGTVTLSNANNTYTGGTTITAGTLIIAGDGSLGTASTGAANTSGCAGANNYSGCIDNAVRATNGIVFESLTEGNGTLQFGTNTSGGTAMASSRNISIGQEIANFNMNGNTVTLTGNLFTPNINTSGAAQLVVDGKGTLILAPGNGNNAQFHGNIEIAKGTLNVASDAAMGATTGSLIGQVEMDNGTFQAGASFASVRSMFMHGSVSTYDTNGFNTSWAGGLTDVQRTLEVTNSSSTTAGNVTFSSLTIGATASLEPTAGTSPGVSVTLTNGITRGANATLMLRPGTGTLGTTEQVIDNSVVNSIAGASATVKNGMVAPWIIEDTGGSASSSPYKFLTYGGSGYVAATAGSTNIKTSTASQLVIQSGNATLSGAASAYALQLQSGDTITATGQTLTLGDGTDPAGLILNSKASISGGTLAFGGGEAVMYVKGSTTNANTISSAITGTGGITLSGSGQLNLNTASQNTGAFVINSGQLVLGASNAISASSGLLLQNTNSKAEPGNAILSLTTSNAIAAINDNGTNSQIFLGGAGAAGTTQTGAGIVLTVGQTTGPNANLSSSVSSTISDSGATTGTAGAITKVGSGLLDLTGGGTGGVTLNAASTIAVNGGQFRLNTDTLANNNAIATASGTEVQLEAGGTAGFGSSVTGGALLHILSGNMQLTGAGNSYTGGTTLEIGTTLAATTATLSSAANQNITNAGGTLVLDQTTTGNFTAIMTDGVPGVSAAYPTGESNGSPGTSQPGSFVKADSTGANGGNVTIANPQQYSGATTVEAGTLTLGAVDTVRSSSGVTLGTVGGGATANLALGANNTVQGLNSVAGNTTGVQLNGNALTVRQTTGAVSSFGGNISDTGAGSVNTTGTGGTLALSGTNQIGGTMSVGAGTTISQTGGSLSVAGNVTNNGTFAVSGTTASYGGTFTNNGMIVSDPSTQSFNNLSIGANGSIQASAGDLYRVGGNFLNSSTRNTVWNTTSAALEFDGATGTDHLFQLVGSDNGTTLTAAVNNFAWAALTVDGGNSLTLEDGLTGGGAVAFYANDVIGAIISGNSVTNIIGDGFNMYYDPYDAATAYLDGLNYNLVDGGQLIADDNLPEPTSLALLLSGLAGSVLVRRRARPRLSK
jgi:fibronectin-binding autotransporter adhesin